MQGLPETQNGAENLSHRRRHNDVPRGDASKEAETARSLLRHQDPLLRMRTSIHSVKRLQDDPRPAPTSLDQVEVSTATKQLQRVAIGKDRVETKSTED